jgi:hypothetical protein
MNEDNKRIDIEEFRELGYLQEVNRRFLHPLGLALEIIKDDNGNELLGGIWDYRDDIEGIWYGINESPSSQERKERFYANKLFVDKELVKRCKHRKEMLGFDIEPVNAPIVNNDNCRLNRQPKDCCIIQNTTHKTCDGCGHNKCKI